jgi:phage terminase small subunit
MALSYKQQAFVDYYLANGHNATKAAEAAGYAAPGQAGHKLLKKGEIRTEITARTATRAMSADEALQRLADRARVSIADFFDVDDDGNLVLNLQRARDSGKLDLIDGITYDRRGNPILKLPDRAEALTLIGRNLGLWVDRVQQDTTLRLDVMTDDQLREYILDSE